MFFLVVDAFSKWPFVFDLGREASTTKAVLCLLEVLGIFGIPDVIVSDNGPQFTSHAFRLFCDQNGIRHKTSPPYHPTTNGQVERMVQELKKALKTRAPNVPIAVFLSTVVEVPICIVRRTLRRKSHRQVWCSRKHPLLVFRFFIHVWENFSVLIRKKFNPLLVEVLAVAIQCGLFTNHVRLFRSGSLV